MCADFPSVLPQIRAPLEDPQTPKVGYDLKQVQKCLRQAGIPIAGPQFDLMLAVYILAEGEWNGSLANLPALYPEAVPQDVDVQALQDAYVRAETARRTAATEETKEQTTLSFFDDEPEEKAPAKAKKLPKITPPDATAFAEFQRPFFTNLYPILRQRLAEQGMETVCYGLEFPLIEVLSEMEFHGISVDLDALKTLHEQFQTQIDQLQAELYTLAGEDPNAEKPLNLNSPTQLRTILFDRLKLDVIRKTKSGASTDAGVLEELAERHPFPKKLLEYRQLVKLQSTYVEALPKLINPETERIHTSFNQAVTATGRLSSSDPNLQNIPVRTELGRKIREAFVACPADWSFVSADYSQIELRVLAHYCADPNLCQAFHNDEDIHTRTASRIFSVALEDVTKPMRNIAKTVNFGIIYGQSPFGLSKQLNIPPEEAQHFIQTYFEQFSSIQRFLEETLDDAREHGFVSTLLGRRRRLTGIREVRKGSLNAAERMAVNTVIQGSAADLIKLAMLHVHERLHHEKLRSHVLLQIHDELLLEVPDAEMETIQMLLVEEMTNAWQLAVPLKVDIESSRRWD